MKTIELICWVLFYTSFLSSLAFFSVALFHALTQSGKDGDE